MGTAHTSCETTCRPHGTRVSVRYFTRLTARNCAAKPSGSRICRRARRPGSSSRSRCWSTTWSRVVANRISSTSGFGKLPCSTNRGDGRSWLSTRLRNLSDSQCEGLQEVEVRAAQGKGRMPRITEGGELVVILAGQVRPQALAPGVPKNRLDKIGFVCVVQRRDALDDESLHSNVAQCCATQQSHDRTGICQLSLRKTIAIPV